MVPRSEDWAPHADKIPNVGVVLWCYFPYVTQNNIRTGKSGQKHPVLVLDTVINKVENKKYLIVAGGRTKVGHAKSSDILIYPSGVNEYREIGKGGDMLKYPTCFSLLSKDILRLDYTTEWFYRGHNHSTLFIGEVLFSSSHLLQQDLKKAMLSTNAKVRIQELRDCL